ncbi:hypothetical protein VNO77_41754 [Canavalia gladiata]|uniref:Uncharacterized protein n=1 Tax=Canavalia gladiata TaxID=3824 RepID=A0AAN9JZT8_CANGL
MYCIFYISKILWLMHNAHRFCMMRKLVDFPEIRKEEALHASAFRLNKFRNDDQWLDLMENQLLRFNVFYVSS